MARYRNRGMALRPVHRIKHVVDTSATVAAGVALTTDVIKSVDAPVIANTNEVETGSKVNGIYLKVIAASNEATVAGAIPNVYLAIRKNPSHALPADAINNIGDSDQKKYVIHQEMVMIQNVISSNPTTVFNGVVVIPKGYVRNGPNDRLEVTILCPQIDISFCLQCHYKEFR